MPKKIQGRNGGTLHALQKGETANPNGRPKGVENSKTRLLRLLKLVQVKTNPINGEKEEFSVMEQIDMAIITKALKGDIKAYQEILDRLEGKATQEIKQTGETPVTIKVIRDGDTTAP